jgi:hypothetical protein
MTGRHFTERTWTRHLAAITLFNEQDLEDRADRAVLEDHLLLLQLVELVECHM